MNISSKTTIQKYYAIYRVPAILLLIAGIFIFNGVHQIENHSITSDEASFYNYAVRFLKGNPERSTPRIDNSKMPVSVLNTIPRIVEQLLSQGLNKSDFGNSDIYSGRYVTLFVALLSMLLVFNWAKELFGTNAGLFASFLFAFCPNNISNASYVTTDSYAVFMLLLTLYLLWQYLQKRKLVFFILFSIAIAASQLVKQSLFHLYIITPLIIVVYYTIQSNEFNLGKVPLRILIFIFVNWMVINLGYYFFHSNLLLGDYVFMSSLFQQVQNMLPSWLVVPFPEPFITGLDQAKYYDSLGGGINGVSSFGKVTILGNESTGGSFWYYYLVSIWYKTPIGFLMFFVWALFHFLKSLKEQKIHVYLFLMLPVVYYLLVFSLFYNTQCGIRHIIFIYPLMFIFSSQIISRLYSIRAKFLFGVLCLYVIISVSFYRNNLYAYTNEWIIDKKTAYLKVGVSNLEFQQGGLYLNRFLKSHVDFKYPSEKKESGNFIIATDHYMDIFNRGTYSWIRDYKPYDHYNFNYLLIKVP